MTLDWPSHMGERTPPADRERTRKFGRNLTLGKATSKLETQMERLDPDDWKVSTGSGGAYTKSNGLPKHNANPDDPGVVVRWTADGADYAVGCDRFTKLRNNLREATLWIEETRKRSDRPVVTGSDDFAAAQLPPPGEQDGVVVAGNGHRKPPNEVLGVDPDAPEAVVRGAARAMKAEHHPDQGGDREQFQRICEAEEAMLGEPT